MHEYKQCANEKRFLRFEEQDATICEVYIISYLSSASLISHNSMLVNVKDGNRTLHQNTNSIWKYVGKSEITGWPFLVGIDYSQVDTL